MRLVATEYISIDGVFEEPGHWSGPWFGEDAGKFKWEELQNADAQLLGRVTYEGFAKAWPTMKDTGEFGERMNGMPKYLVSSTIEKGDWNNTTVLTGNLADEVAKLKGEPGNDLLIAGSGQLVRALTEDGPIDEYRFMLHPVILGRGKRLFPEGTAKFGLKHVDTRPLSTGIVVLTYHPAEGRG
jgi:dihydrofolate reductase